MALANYTDLQASIASYLHRTDLSVQIVDFIALAEARIARDLRLRSQVTTATLTTTANSQAVALPTGWLENENVSLTGTLPVNLRYANIEYLDTAYPDGYSPSRPAVYSIEGNNMLLGPTPDAAYTIALLYYKKMDALAVTPTNFLLTTHPSIYLFAALAEACTFLEEDARVSLWEAKYKKDLADVQSKDTQGQFSGAALRVRTL